MHKKVLSIDGFSSTRLFIYIYIMFSRLTHRCSPPKKYIAVTTPLFRQTTKFFSFKASFRWSHILSLYHHQSMKNHKQKDSPSRNPHSRLPINNFNTINYLIKHVNHREVDTQILIIHTNKFLTTKPPPFPALSIPVSISQDLHGVKAGNKPPSI